MYFRKYYNRGSWLHKYHYLHNNQFHFFMSQEHIVSQPIITIELMGNTHYTNCKVGKLQTLLENHFF